MSKQVDDSSLKHVPTGVRRRIQQTAFSLLYRAGGRVYDRTTNLLFGEAWDRWRRSTIPLAERGPLLDLGCGTALLVDEFIARGIESFGVDRESSMLRGARTKGRARGRLVRADAGALPFKSDVFASVVATFPAPFILERSTLAEIARVLRGNGSLVVVLTGYTDEHARWRWPVRQLLRIFYGGVSDRRRPAADLLAFPGLPGEWRWVDQPPDHVLLWIATRVNEVDSTAPVTP